ncbi:biotinidase isoform X2 [Boleophthalmus pectinirostris]|uniref:biotinidase isoform X2 n=1 Tax=Boleophthalmus pectinirostris TaxID=150288 RepID=UPI00242A87BA|nr:biotinidase isoform X2 [Boleophthalmus pectinirostris]
MMQALVESLFLGFWAAVYEHRVTLNPEPRVPLSRSAALRHLRQNLQVYSKQASRAALQGAQILVFPEDGLQGFNFTRSSIAAYLEVVPDPQQESWNPCEDPQRHPNTEVQQWLSCIARTHGLYVVANMGSVQPCSRDSGSPCPPDGRWHFNTNVVYRSDGLLVARYHKQNLYFEEAFDTPQHMELVTFDTPFAGKFGLITCFDILFQQPTVSMVEKGVRQFIFPTAWMNQLPLLDAIQFQQAFSLGANVTLLAANIRSDELIMTGSGIYSPSSAVYHHAQRGDPEEGQLVVATLRPLGPLPDAPALQVVLHKEQGYTEVRGCRSAGCKGPLSFTSSMMHDPFTFVLLNRPGGQLSVCNGSFCCWLQYQCMDSNFTEVYALGAFAGMHTVNGHYSLQVCALVKCAGGDARSCGQEVLEAQTKMDFVLEGTFNTKHVYPSVLSSHYTLEQPLLHTMAHGTVTMAHSHMRAGLITAALYGRTYHLDLH